MRPFPRQANSTTTSQVSSTVTVWNQHPTLVQTSDITSSSLLLTTTTTTTTSSTPSVTTSTSILSSTTTSDVRTTATFSTTATTTTGTTPSIIASPTTPSTATTSPPTSSTTPQNIPTTITSSYTTYLSGSPILTSTPIPSTIPDPSPTSSNRTAIIAGSAAGGTAFILLILTLAFCTRRQRFKRLDFLHALTLRRKQARSRATLLDPDPDGGADRHLGLIPPSRGYEYGVVGSTRSIPTLTESGSAFREEMDVPHEHTRLMDDVGTGFDLGRIVDDVMGPGHYSDRSVSSVYRGSVVASEGGVHSRTVSNASHLALLDAAGLTSGSGPGSTAPVRSSPLAQQDV